VVRVAGKPVAVFRRAAAPAGDPAAGLFAREMACKHQNADLTRGTIAGGQVTCPRHGWRYDLATGACLDHDALPLRAHEVVVEDGWVFVALTPSAGPRPGV
jgi:nitrite reductase/ring-hydroxylating ferredoxin subunit